jgi:hypothetical protein
MEGMTLKQYNLQRFFRQTEEETQMGKPITVFNDRELATVLHALRLYQDVRMYGRERSPEYGCSDQTGCDHFEEVPPLSVEEIDALCERLNLGPEKPKEKPTEFELQQLDTLRAPCDCGAPLYGIVRVHHCNNKAVQR